MARTIKVSRIKNIGKVMRYFFIGISIGLCILFLILFYVSTEKDQAKDPTTGLSKNTPLWKTGNMDYLALSFIFATGPFGFYEYARLRRLNKIEDKFPDFLRDLAEYWKGGLSMTAAVETLAKGEYGALNKDVKLMANQISWGIAFNEVLRLFVDRAKTRLIERSITLIEEANKSGGKISDILVTAANDAREIKWLQLEREKNIITFVTIIYVSFFVYIAIIAILSAVFIPAIADATLEMKETQEKQAGGMGSGLASVGVQINLIDKPYLGFIFFCSGLIQGLGNGIVGGIMGEGTLAAGLRHAFIMCTLTWIIFAFMIFGNLNLNSSLANMI